jgi:hypothetical protein
MLNANARSLLYWLCATIALGASGNVAVAADRSPAPAAKANPIDWRTVENGSPIPHQLPVVADADTGLAAGFAPQWIQRAITPWPPMMADPDLPAKLVQRIANGERRAGDQWAHEVASRLRDSLRIHGNADTQRYTRIFCGSQGCLAYFETRSDSSSVEAYDHARSGLLHAMLDDNGWGKAFGITAANVGEVGETGVWELVYIVRGKPVSE